MILYITSTSELENLVIDSRHMITKHMELQTQILTNNYTTLLHKLNNCTQSFLSNMKESNLIIVSESDLANSLIYIVNMLTDSDTWLKDIFMKGCTTHIHNNYSNKNNKSKKAICNNNNNNNNNEIPISLRDTNNNTNTVTAATNTTNNNIYTDINNHGSVPIPFQPITRKSIFFRKISLFFSFHRLHDSGLCAVVCRFVHVSVSTFIMYINYCNVNASIIMFI